MHKQNHVVIRALLAVAFVLALLPGVVAAQSEPQDIVAIAAGNADFSTLVSLVQEAGLVEALQAGSALGDVTVFAPTNDAFAKVPKEVVDALLADKALLTAVLTYHVVPGKVMSTDLSDGMQAKTAQGEELAVKIADGKVAVNDANVVAADIAASNGVIHVIDSVLVPQSVLDALAASAEATPEAMADASAAPEAAAAEMPATDIVDTAAAAGSFNRLLAAAEAAGLVDALKGEGPLTVFAPTDEAFAAIPEGTLAALLSDPTGDLKDILLYHVVPGAVMSSDLSDGASADTLQGAPVTFTVGDGKVAVNDANVVTPDIKTSNGVIHVIDKVLLRPAPAATEAPAMVAASDAPTTMPVTGGESNTWLVLVLGGVIVLALTGFALVSRRRMA
ncbi:MAG: fasciclin domain-containing protein [Anaerolineales bacterium]|nr:fasciclin domain-containing protein [Anaerolineales bacterium]